MPIVGAASIAAGAGILGGGISARASRQSEQRQLAANREARDFEVQREATSKAEADTRRKEGQQAYQTAVDQYYKQFGDAAWEQYGMPVGWTNPSARAKPASAGAPPGPAAPGVPVPGAAPPGGPPPAGPAAEPSAPLGGPTPGGPSVPQPTGGTLGQMGQPVPPMVAQPTAPPRPRSAPGSLGQMGQGPGQWSNWNGYGA